MEGNTPRDRGARKCLAAFKLNLALVLVSVTIGLLIAELLTRTLFPQFTYAQGSAPEYFRPSSILPFELQPGFSGVFVRPDYHMAAHINAQGYRGKDFRIERDSALQGRILIVGDSFTFGLGVNDDETYAARLEEVLKGGGARYEVINGGYVGGFSPDSYYAYLTRKGLALQPDLVVVGLFVWNDVTDLFETEWLETDGRGLPTRVASKARQVNERGQFIMKKGLPGSQYVYPPPMTVLADSQLYSLLMRIYHRARYQVVSLVQDEIISNYSRNSIFNVYTIHQPPYPPKLEEKFQAVLRLVEGMNQTCQDSGAGFLLMLIPTEFQVYPETWTKYRSYGITQPFSPGEDGLDQPQARILSFCRERSIQCLDLLPQLRRAANNSRTMFFAPDGHWNAEGNRLVAQVLGQAIHANRKAPREAPSPE